MHIQLPPALEAMVQDQVASGLYRDELEVVSEALRLLERRTFEEMDWNALEAAVAEADADLAAGRFVDVEAPETLTSSLPPA